MPRSRKRHHSRSRSRSRSQSRDRSFDKHKRNESCEKDGKRRRVDEVDSPLLKRSLRRHFGLWLELTICRCNKDTPIDQSSFSSPESHNSNSNEVQSIQDVEGIIPELDSDKAIDNIASIEETNKQKIKPKDENSKKVVSDCSSLNKDTVENLVTSKLTDIVSAEITYDHVISKKENSVTGNETQAEEIHRNVSESEFGEAVVIDDSDSSKSELGDDQKETNKISKAGDTMEISYDDKNSNHKGEDVKEQRKVMQLEKMDESDSDELLNVSDSDSSKMEVKEDKKEKLTTPRKPLTPRQIQKKLEVEKRKQEKQKEREDRERQRQEEKAKVLAEKERIRQQKEVERQKFVEQKQKEKEMKEEQKRKEKEELEQKRQEKELKRKEKEAQKRQEKELERLKKQQEIEEKNREKQREEEKKQKTAALFVGFFKKTEGEEKERKTEKVNSNFMPFEVKSDMRMPPSRRNPLRNKDMEVIDSLIENQDDNASYLKELKSGANKVGKSAKTWPYEDPEDEITIVCEDKILGETICDDKSMIHRTKAKFLFFHENRRPAYFGTWRKKSKFVRPRRPFGEDTGIFHYEEDSDDDWEDEGQGESLDASAGEEDKDGDNAEDEYEVDNDFFVPHGHLSDDEIDDEENSRLSPESLKQKLKLLKDEFDEEIKSKTHRLKPRSIGCIWFNKKSDNVEEAIQRYLHPFAMIIKEPIEIKKPSEIFMASPEKKKLKPFQELPPEHLPYFLKIIHGNVNNKKKVIEQFLTYMTNNGFNVEVSKISLLKFLKKIATYRRYEDNGPLKNKFGWFVNNDICEKYNVNLESSGKTVN